MNSGFTATRVAARPPAPASRAGTRCSSAVPGSTVLRSTTVCGSARLRTAWPMLWPVRTTASKSRRPLARLGVPTQIRDRSDSATAWSLEVVARRRPAPTTSWRSSGRPGSMIGEAAWLIMETFSALTSTPTTVCPAFARQAAVTHPTYPRPNTLTRIPQHLPTLVFEFVDDLRPRVPLLDESPARRAERAALRGIAQERGHRLGEGGGIVGAQEMPARRQWKALGAHRGRDDGLGHRERLEDLEPASAADPERHYVHRRLGHVRPDVVDETGHPHARRRSDVAESVRWVSADHGQGGRRDLAADARQHRLDEVGDAVLVRVPVHRAGEDEPSRDLRDAVGREVVDVDARRHRANPGGRRDGGQQAPIGVR